MASRGVSGVFVDGCGVLILGAKRQDNCAHEDGDGKFACRVLG